MRKGETKPPWTLAGPWRWRLGRVRRLWMHLALAACLALFAPLAGAAPDERETSKRGFAPQPGVASQRGLSVDRAVRLVREQVDGRVLSVAPIDGGRRGYEVRVLLREGRVKTIRLDRDGRIREP